MFDSRSRVLPWSRRLWSRRLTACALVLGAVAAQVALAPLARAAEKVTIQLKWQHQFQFAGFYAAQDQGYYRDVGLDVTLLEAQPTSDPVRIVTGGRAQYGVGNTNLLLERAKGEPVVVLATIFQHSAAALLVREGADGKPRPWPGSRLMIAPQNEELIVFLKKQGVNLDAVQLLPHSSSFQELIEGRVDAMSGYTTLTPGGSTAKPCCWR